MSSTDTTPRRPLGIGTLVDVHHDLGWELGTVVSVTRGPDCPRVTVRFADDTVSSWAAHQVVRHIEAS